MDKKWEGIELKLDFLSDESKVKKEYKGSYKIVISDDDAEVHTITKMILKDFEFERHSLIFLDAYTGEETKEILRNNPDTAILFQDVVMEESHTGLKVVEYLRNNLKNTITRIVLRTGQPGEAPEDKVIRDYDINDYRLKTELTVSRLHTTLISTLRSYRDLTKLDKYRKGLEKIIQTSANLFTHNTLSDFLTSILDQLAGFYLDNPEMLYIINRDGYPEKNGFVTLNQGNIPVIMAATGKYAQFIGKDIKTVPDLKVVSDWMSLHDEKKSSVDFVGKGFIIRNNGVNHQNNYIFIEGSKEIYDFELIQLFLSNYSVALDNYILNNMIFSTQKEIIITLGEVVEKHFDETGSHVRRISSMMYKLATHLGFSYSECEKLKVASTMHDIGKIAIPDAILKKPGKLTFEEFEIVKTHSYIGHRILAKSDLEILKIAAEIAMNHHEKVDGSGYPKGLKGRGIPLYARMLAIVDVFDAISHRRVYKEASSYEETLDYIIEQKDKHFDPMLVDIFVENFDDITAEEENF